MDCNSLIAMIESKYSKMLGPFGPEEDLSETERLKYIDATSEFFEMDGGYHAENSMRIRRSDNIS